MNKFIRLTNRYFDNLLVRKSEEVGYCYDGIHDDSPYSFCYCEFKGRFRRFPEESANCLVGCESLYHGEYVVLQGRNRCMGNLLSKILCLALSHTEQSIAFLEDDLDRPSHRVYRYASKKSSFVFVVIRPPHSPRLDLRMKKRRHGIPANVTSAVMYQHLSFLLYLLVSFLFKRLTIAGAVSSSPQYVYLVLPCSPTLMHPR